jgi:hypothetical protein
VLDDLGGLHGSRHHDTSQGGTYGTQLVQRVLAILGGLEPEVDERDIRSDSVL